MADRLISVTAYTTLDLVDAVAKSHEFTEETYGIVNATSPRKNPDVVQLQFELDNMTEKHLPAHMDEYKLTPEQARTLAADLEKHADKVEAALE